MEVKARLNYLRIAPRKVRLVASLIRRKKIEEARTALGFIGNRAAKPLLKLLNSAVANAKNNFQVETDNLFIRKITVDEGPKLKRWRAGSRGRAFPVQKKTSHITLILQEIKEGKKAKRPAKTRSSAEMKEEKEIREEKKIYIKPEISQYEEKEREKAREAVKKEKRPLAGMAKPKERGGIRRFFRRKSF